MGFAGYVSVCVQLYCVGFHCISLHVSAYLSIFRCVGYFIFICLKDSASLLFFSRGHTLHVSICVFPVLQATRQTHTQGTTKITKENGTEKHKWKRAECDCVKKRQKKAAKQNPSSI
jgi:hypothetical protein